MRIRGFALVGRTCSVCLCYSELEVLGILKETAFRDKATGEVIPSGPKHDEAMKAEKVGDTPPDRRAMDRASEEYAKKMAAERYARKMQDRRNAETRPETSSEAIAMRAAQKPWVSQEGHTPETPSSKYEQGFVDEDGKFLDRKQALERAKATEQIPAGQTKFDFADEGLHSGDLRRAGVEAFNVPVPVETRPITAAERAEGKSGIAFHTKDEEGKSTGIVIDPEGVKKSWEDSNDNNKPWIKQNFETAKEYQDFITKHEQEHTISPQREGESTLDYEKRITKQAMEKHKASIPAPDREIPIPNDDKEAADSLHSLDTNESADKTELQTTIETMEKEGVTPEIREKIYDYEEGHGKLSPIEKEAYDKYIKPIKDKITSLFDRQVKLGRTVSPEMHPDFIPRVRLWTPKGVTSRLSDWWDKLTRQEGAFAEKIGGDPSIFEKRNLFVHETPNGKRLVIQKVGDRYIRWKDGKPSGFYKDGKFVGNEIHLLKSDIANLKEARVNELHEHTPYRYSKDSAHVLLTKLNELKKFDRANNFLSAWTKSPQFKNVATADKENIPKGWITPKYVDKIPQLAGYFFEPKTAWVIEDFAKSWKGSQYMKLTSALIKNMMLNPLPHIFNEAMHVFAARGATGWASPRALTMFARTGSKAMQDVWNQSELYREVMREGGSIMSADLRANQYTDMLLSKAAKEAAPELESIASKAGMALPDLYKAILNKSNKLMWMSRDAMYLQLIRETQLRNPKMTLKETITKVEQHIPNYRVPTTVMGHRGLSEILQNPNVSVFSKYHYGLVNSMAHVVKDMNPKNLKTIEGRQAFRQGLDSALAYALGMAVFYPMMDKIAQAMFGDDSMTQRRAGPFHVLDAIVRLGQGKAETQALLSPIFTFNPVLLAGGELLFDRKLYSGRPIYNTNDPLGLIARDVGNYTLHAVPQAGAVIDTSQTEGGWIAKQMDIKSKSSKAQAIEKRALAIKERQRKQRLRKYEQE